MSLVTLEGSEGTAGAPAVPWGRFLTAVSALAAAGALGLVVTAYLALRTLTGPRLDHAALDAVSNPPLDTGLLSEEPNWTSLGTAHHWLLVCVSLVILVLLLAFLTLVLVRRRLDLLVGAVVVIGGSNFTTQVLKYNVFPGLDLSHGPISGPSGHTTVALSLGLAAIIMAPVAWRSTVALGVSAGVALVSVGLVLGRFHLPSAVIAAGFVCLMWAAFGLLAAALVSRRTAHPARDTPTRVGATVGASVIGGLLVSWGARTQPGLRDFGLGIIVLAVIVLACALVVYAVARVADRHLG